MGVNKVKDNGKLWEKRRRDRIKESFQKLARLLPQHDPAKLPPQNEILDKATEFVKELRLSNSRLLNQQSQPDEKTKLIQELQDEVNKLILRVKQLTVLLVKAKIPIPSGPFIKSLGKRKLKWTGIVSSDDIENSCKSRRLASSENDKSSSTTAKQSKATETPGRCAINCSDSAGKPEGTTVPLRETNATGKKKVTGPIAEAVVQILNSGESCGILQQKPPTPTTPNQQPAVSQTTITLTPSNPISVASSISGAIQGFPATIIISQPCGTTIGHSLQQLQVSSQPILPKPLPNAAWPKIAISRITQPIIKEKKTRRRKKKSDAIVLSANAEVQTVEVQTPVVEAAVVQTVEVEAAVVQIVETPNKPEDQLSMEVEVETAILNETTPNEGELVSKESVEPVTSLKHNIDGETCAILGDGDSHAISKEKPMPDGSLKVGAKEKQPNSLLPKSQQKENNIVVPPTKVTAVNSVTTPSDNTEISLRDKLCTGITAAKDVSVLHDRSSFPFQESSNIETGNSDEVALADASLAHKDEVQDKTQLPASSTGIAESTSSSVMLKDTSEGLKKMVNNNATERIEQPESTITDALFPQHQFDCTSGSLNNITDTFDDIEAIIIPKRNKLTEKSVSTSAMKLIPSTEAKDKAGDLVRASASTQEDVQLTSDKISECIARSIDLIEQPGSELMDLSADWGDGSSPKSPMSPTKMFLSMFPLSLRDSSAPSDQSNTKSYNYSGIGKSSFHIDAMLPDDTCANASNCNIPSVSGIVSSQNVCSSLQPLNNPSDDYLSIVSSFVAGSCAKNAIEGFSMNLSTDVDGPESSNPFSFINSSDIGGAEGNFLSIRPGNAKDSVGCIENTVGETEKDGYMGLASWISKPPEKYTNTASVFTNYPPYSSSNAVTSSSINIPTLLPALVGNSSGSNLLLGDSPVKKKPSNKRDAGRWPGVSQKADPPFRIEHVAHTSSNFQHPPLQSNTGARTSSAMQFTISDLMGSVNSENVSNSQPCASSSRRSQNSFNADLFSATAVTNKNTGNENVCQYKPYEDHFTGFNPITSQVSSSQSQSVATGTSSIATMPSYIPDFQSGYVQYNSRAEHPVPFNHNYTSGFSNAQSFVPTDIYSSAVIPTNNLNRASQPSSSSKRNNQDEGSHPAKVAAVAPKPQQRASKAKASREERPKQAATSKQTVESTQIRQTNPAVPAVDVTRRNFETWSSSSYIYNDTSSRVPSSVNVQPMPKGSDSQPAPAKTKPSTKGSTNAGTRKYEKRNATTSAETATGRASKGSNSGTRGSQKSNTSLLIESQPKSKSCVAEDNVHNANSMTAPAYGRNSNFYDQTGNQSHNQLFYLPDVTQVPIPTVPAVSSIEMLPFQPSIAPMRHHVQPTEYQPVGLMTPRNPANEIRSNNFPNYIRHDNPPNPTAVTPVRNQNQRGYEAPAQGHLMQNIFSHSANTENKNVQQHFNASVNCANEVQRTNTNQEASVNRPAISSTKKSNKPAEVSYSSSNVQDTNRSQPQQRQQQPRSYTNSEISPPVNSSGPESVSWPTTASRINNNNTSCQQKPDSSIPNAFSVSKLVGNTTSSSNNQTSNSNRHCVEGLIRKSCANNWNNFNPITSSNSFNSNLQMNDNTLANTAPKVQAYQPAGTQDYGNYNFMPTHSHHQVASMAQPSQPSHQPYVTNLQSSSSSNHQNFPSHYNYFDASSTNFMSTPSQVPQLPPGGNSGIHQSNPSPRNSGRGNIQENPVCQQQQPNFPRFHHGSNNNNAGIHLQQHQQQATSSVSNFNLSSIFPEMNQEVSRNSGDRASHQTSDGQRDNCSSGYYQNQRTN